MKNSILKHLNNFMNIQAMRHRFKLRPNSSPKFANLNMKSVACVCVCINLKSKRVQIYVKNDHKSTRMKSSKACQKWAYIKYRFTHNTFRVFSDSAQICTDLTRKKFWTIEQQKGTSWKLFRERLVKEQVLSFTTSRKTQTRK